jgi:xanthine/uracil/vitamin C permease (AzgA family)
MQSSDAIGAHNLREKEKNIELVEELFIVKSFSSVLSKVMGCAYKMYGRESTTGLRQTLSCGLTLNLGHASCTQSFHLPINGHITAFCRGFVHLALVAVVVVVVRVLTESE